MKDQTNDSLKRVGDFWGKTAADRAENPIQGWLDSKIVLEAYVQPRQTGSPHTNWLAGVMERLHIPKDGRWLSLGCGSAGLEIFASKLGSFRSLLGLDVSEAALEQARKDAASQGIRNIEFEVADLNSLQLAPETFDVVLMAMSLHHIRELRHTLIQIERTLKPGGFFIINEYIGPRQFQFSDLQLNLVKELLAALPERWRKDFAGGGIKREYRKMPLEYWEAADPSEAIRSDLIVREIERRFRIIDRRDYGGAILHLLLEHIVHNFDEADEKDVAVIRLLGKFEEILGRHGVLRSDFTVMVMKKRAGRSILRSILERHRGKSA
ncbi:MAG TPA: class I SAM-dependent methyltransferase [Acidobacteriota bacterium]|jgi:ubiquinone/menaquinone biosynthesis C-methylase UbiE